VEDKLPPRAQVYAVSRDGLWLWGFDPQKGLLFRFALRGVKAEDKAGA
jgi:hypothetical protein